jgi:hypothetical protein
VLQPFTEGDSRYQATLTFGGSAGKREGIAWPLRTLLVGVSLWWAPAFVFGSSSVGVSLRVDYGMASHREPIRAGRMI